MCVVFPGIFTSIINNVHFTTLHQVFFILSTGLNGPRCILPDKIILLKMTNNITWDMVALSESRFDKMPSLCWHTIIKPVLQLPHNMCRPSRGFPCVKILMCVTISLWSSFYCRFSPSSPSTIYCRWVLLNAMITQIGTLKGRDWAAKCPSALLAWQECV